MSSPSPSSATAATRKRRARVLRALSQAQQVSALAFGSFAVVHLAAPALALIARRNEAHELATGTMLLGRVWYQNVLSEPIIVWGALSVHLASSFARKGIVVLFPASSTTSASPLGRQLSDKDEGDEGQQVERKSQDSLSDYVQGLCSYGKSAFRRLSTFSDLHTVSGWILAPFVLHHAYLNRIVPSNPQHPISALSPSELEYTYVAHAFGPAPGALQTPSWIPSRAVLSSVAYATLIGLSMYHSAHGVRKILAWSARGSGTGTSDRRKSVDSTESSSETVASGKVGTAARRRRPWNLAAGVATVVLCGGLTRLVMEADGSPPFLSRRFEACYTLVWPYTRAV
ncbi:hypothetical protein CF327_g5570 [Tilletia walkeri]|uniref:Mitochondrial adapter protein MCP1 transmembrane domain-containing protein n=1 Tax=Tilletia walkeri TaxID=117179 RepID=A0A8X7NA01_9BASI|nr:hypothetical protein CF327_g5570 [Tilletia walkeri]KAE8269389.1 hypothetical protein A4X09_0g2962 [Tilletia walkeri]